MTFQPCPRDPRRPRWYGETAALAEVARFICRQRAETYPALVEQGKVPAAEAAHATAVARAIADDWSWAESPHGPPPSHPGITRGDRIASLEHALQRWQARTTAAAADRATGADRLQAHHDLVELIATLLWRERQPIDIATLNRLTHQARLQAATEERKAA